MSYNVVEMSLIFRLIVLVMLAVTALRAQTPVEQGWNGLKVYQSSRSDVERVLKQVGKKVEPGFTVYRTEDRNVLVRYWEKQCIERKTASGRYKIYSDTLIDLDVGFFKPTVPISELKWNKSKYDGGPDQHYLDVIHYYNPSDRIWITANIENGIEFFASVHYLEIPAIVPDQPCK